MLNVARLYRHPIKGIGAEELSETPVHAGQTLPMDRVWALAHEAAKVEPGNWSNCNNFIRGAKSPGVMAVTARSADGLISLRHPDLPPLTVDPGAHGPQLIDWIRPVCNPDRAAPSALIRAGSQGMTDSPFPSISILNYASLRALEDAAGRTLDPRRFRGNIWFDGGGPWQEFEWIGNTILIGGVQFEVRERISRCTATHVDPDTGRADTDTLKVLEQTWGHQDFGIYAVATTGGQVAVGDPVELL